MTQTPAEHGEADATNESQKSVEDLPAAAGGHDDSAPEQGEGSPDSY